MATTRLRSLSLSLALHGAVVACALWVGIARPPPTQPPAEAVTIVWVDVGAPALAGASRGDGGAADPVEPDPAGEVLNESIAAVDDPERTAPSQLDARDPVSGADRPAPPQTEPTDEDRERRSDERTAQDYDAALAAADGAAEPLDAVPKQQSRDPVSQPLDADPQPTEPVPQLAEPVPQPSRPVPQLVEPASQSHSPAQPAVAAEMPIAPTEQRRLQKDVMDLLNRSRELPSRPSVAWSSDGREYRAEMKRVRSAGTTGVEEAVIEIVTEHDGRHISTELHVKRLAFSHYAQLIDRWDPNVQIHDDVFDGRVHANTEIVIENSGTVQPVFHGLVTAAGGIDTSRSTRRVRREQVFLGGLETRAPRIALPKRFDPHETIELEAADAVVLDTDSRIVFFADGTYDIRPSGGGRARRGTLGPSPAYFIAAEKSAVGVEGTVNGQVLIYSPKEIVIEGDLRYAADPKSAAGSDDYLGLVSDGSVEIAGPDVTGPGDLSVYAAIYAKRRFAVRRYSRGDRATLFVYGSITAGSLTATEPRFRTKIEFDRRLEHARPPSFPMTDRYELAAWDGVWRAGP